MRLSNRSASCNLKSIISTGVPFVATPYRAGTHIREEVFWRQFTVICQGGVQYPEDDPILRYVVDVSRPRTSASAALIEDAMSLADTHNITT